MYVEGYEYTIKLFQPWQVMVMMTNQKYSTFHQMKKRKYRAIIYRVLCNNLLFLCSFHRKDEEEPEATSLLTRNTCPKQKTRTSLLTRRRRSSPSMLELQEIMQQRRNATYMDRPEEAHGYRVAAVVSGRVKLVPLSCQPTVKTPPTLPGTPRAPDRLLHGRVPNYHNSLLEQKRKQLPPIK